MGGYYITVCIGLCAAIYDRTSIVVPLVEKGGVEIVKYLFFFNANIHKLLSESDLGSLAHRLQHHQSIFGDGRSALFSREFYLSAFNCRQFYLTFVDVI